DISQCQFGYTNDAYSTIINANYRGDVAFLYKVGDDLNLNGGGEISCCLNGMSDEVSIPFNQLYPTILQTDPSGGKFTSLRSLTLIPDASEDSSKLPKIESEIERLWFNKNGVRNELAKDNRQKSRFSLAMDNVNLRFRNKHGDVVALKGDDCWEMAKSDA
ncbi:15895_t:CDS:2, partial [Racocetra fulgida]